MGGHHDRVELIMIALPGLILLMLVFLTQNWARVKVRLKHSEIRGRQKVKVELLVRFRHLFTSEDSIVYYCVIKIIVETVFTLELPK